MTTDSTREPAFLAEHRPRVEAALRDAASRFAAELPDPLRAPVAYAISSSGKRLRPILCVAAYRAATAAPPPAALYRLACAPEIVHTYSLVHDDLPCMDNDDLRRGRPTLHRVHGVARATLAGAALLPLAVRVLQDAGAELGLPPHRRALLVAELCRAAGAEGMVGGQLLDLQAEQAPVDAAHLEAIHRAKTGALLTTSLQLGALAAGADEAVLHALAQYGQNLGLAFQIADDILDVTGDAAALGKTAGRDQDLHKASYPALHGLQGARALARRHADRAKAALRGLGAPGLAELADFVVERRS